MLFILMLVIAACSIAGSAGYFSVYGLASTFPGTFWSVIVMGGSLEYGKLVAASYLYRYWKTSPVLLKIYLLLGVGVLMVVTSMGIFGYLSVGYQTDSLPLKQLTQRVGLLNEEKVRYIERKKQIDNQIANLPTEFSKGRIKLMNSFKTEQEQVTSRISELDKEVLLIKTNILQTEAHIGPITYIAKVFNLDADDATKYLIYLIIFVFDPMAIALTLSVNIAILARQKELSDIPIPIDLIESNIEEVMQDNIPTTIITPKTADFATNFVYPTDISFIDGSTLKVSDATTSEKPSIVEEFQPIPIRQYVGHTNQLSLDELLQQFKFFKNKEDHGDILTPEDNWAFQAIKTAIQHQGYNIYI